MLNTNNDLSDLHEMMHERCSAGHNLLTAYIEDPAIRGPRIAPDCTMAEEYSGDEQEHWSEGLCETLLHGIFVQVS